MCFQYNGKYVLTCSVLLTTVAANACIYNVVLLGVLEVTGALIGINTSGSTN